MWIITEKRLKDYTERHPNITSSIKLIKNNQFQSLNELQSVFPNADYTNGLTIFNLSGNNHGIITDIVYSKGRIYIKQIMTHAEYDQWNKRKAKKRRNL